MPLLKRKEPPQERPLATVTPFLPRTPGIWGTSHDGKRQQRVLLASATNISNGSTVNRVEAQRLSKLKQAWQEDAWAYRDSIGELRYATTYLGNALRKVTLFPAAYIPEQLDPQPLSSISDCPAEVVAAAQDALNRLAANPLAMSGLLRDVAENFEVAGECFLLGWPPNTKNENEEEVWEIRSSSEIKSGNDGELSIMEIGSNGSEPIPDTVFASRLWYPHPRRKMLADSPFAAILDLCEELLILSRDIRAAGRSRLANNGLLLLPDTLTVVRANVSDDALDDEQDPFMQELIAAAMTAIQDEGSASAIMPIIVRGPKDDLAAARQLVLSRPESQRANDRNELIERMATALDLPAEVLTGKADLNHWTAWSVSDDTFSDHIEPLVMVIDDAFTAGYMRVALKEAQVDPQWISRIVIWHDATRLVRHPDRSQDAISAYDRYSLSSKALRSTMGFSDTDAPDVQEILLRLLSRAKMDPNVSAQLFKRLDSTLEIPDPNAAPQDSGATPAPDTGGPSAGPPVPPSPAEGPPQNGQPQQTPTTPSAPTPTAQAASGVHPKALVAANIPAHVVSGSKHLSKIDADLTNKLLVATNAAMSRALEKAGARIRTTVGRTASGRAWCATHSNLELPFIISHAMIAAAGLDEEELLKNSWNLLKTEWDKYLADSDSDALNTVAKMLKVDPDELDDLAQSLDEFGDSAWSWLENKLSVTARGYLTNAANIAADEAEGEITTTDLVDYATVREAVARAGGQPSANSAGVLIGEDPHSAPPPLSGLGTGPAVSDTLKSGGMQIASYTWIHGTTPNPFPAHEDLDGVQFESWVDDILRNDGDWPDRAYFAPGDHDGCTCDFDIVWSAPEESDEGSEQDTGESETASAAQFYEGQPRAEGGKFGEGKIAKDDDQLDHIGGMSRKDACQYAWDNAGMAKGTAGKLYDVSPQTLDQSITTTNQMQPDEQVSQAQAITEQKYHDYGATISPEDKAAAQERHARIEAKGGRQGGDDRPGYPTRVKLCQKLTTEYGDGKTCPCNYCGRTLVPETVSLDRVIPGSEGGKYVMPNLAPSCYECNQWRGNTDYLQTMSNIVAENAATATGFVAAGNDQPIVPLGTWVEADCIGYGQSDDPEQPTSIPLQTVAGKLDGYYVPIFDYFKYLCCGFDVDPKSFHVMDDAEIAAANAEPDSTTAAGQQFYEGQPRAEGGKFGEGKAKGIDSDGVAGDKYMKGQLGISSRGKMSQDAGTLKAQAAQAVESKLDPNISATSALSAAVTMPGTASDRDANNFQVAVTYDGYVSKTEDGHLAVSGVSESGFVAANSPEGEQVGREVACSNMLSTWAGTSNDTSVTSLSMQNAAEREFGIQNAAGWNADNATLNNVAANDQKNGDVYQSFVRAQYDATQEKLAADGVQSMTLYRGTSQALGTGQSVDVSLRPMSSFTTSPNTAVRFAYSQKGSETGTVLGVTVPASQILSTPLTGYGCANECEAVVLGGTMQANTLDRNELPGFDPKVIAEALK